MAEKKKILYIVEAMGGGVSLTSSFTILDSRPSREEYRIFHSREPMERSLKQSASSDTESAEAES